MTAWMVRYKTLTQDGFYHIFSEREDAVRFIQHPGNGKLVTDVEPQPVLSYQALPLSPENISSV